MSILPLQNRWFSRGEASRAREQGSTFIIVMWIAFGLVSLALYFGHTMGMEMRAANNRVAGMAADQAIEGAARYVRLLLGTSIANGSNGFLPDPSSYLTQAVPVGDSQFWILGRDTNAPVGAGQIAFGLVDEASKINLNSAPSNILQGLVTALPRANQDLPAAILDWRSTNNTGAYQTYYATRSSPYQTKSAPFETVDELHLVYGGDPETLNGEDANRNGILDPNEEDENRNGQLDPGVLEYMTVYSREPNTQTNGQPRINIRVLTSTPTGPLPTLLQTLFTSGRANEIMQNLGLVSAPQRPGGGRPGVGGPPTVITKTFASPLQFYRSSKMTADEFAKIFNDLTVTNGSFIEGRININTASAAVLASLPGLDAAPDLAQTVINYRQTNPDKLGSIAWIVDAIGQKDNTTLTALQRSDCLTTCSYQFSADVVAVGPHGRGFRRVRFVFDTLEGVPKILYRQDLTQHGWALGKDLRRTLLFAKQTR